MINQALSFVAVVRAGGYSNAAKVTGISKAQLSRQVKQLEQALGIQLIYRTTRTFALTESGQQFFQSCQSLEEHFSAATNSLKKDFSAIKGALRITAPPDFGAEYLPTFIHLFRNKYPNIGITLALSNKNEDLIEQQYDLAFRIANSLPDSDLRMREVAKFKRVLCATPKYLKSKKPLTTLDNLKDHWCITSVNRNGNIVKPQWHFEVNNKPINFTLNNAIEIDSLRAQLELVLLGEGIGRMPDYAIKEQLKSGKLIEVLPKVNKPYSYIYLLYPNRAILPKKIEVFMQLVKEEISAGRFPFKK